MTYLWYLSRTLVVTVLSSQTLSLYFLSLTVLREGKSYILMVVNEHTLGQAL